MSMRVIVVDDEEDIARLIEHKLVSEGYKVEVCEDGLRALDAVRRQTPDLMILDVMLPQIDGKDVCRILRKDHSFPIIMLSARSEDVDKVVGLEMGADDYITKPFSMIELVARVRAALRRSQGESNSDSEVLRGANIVLDKARHTVQVSDVEVTLRFKEFALLEYLMANKSRVIDRDSLLEKVWGEDEYVDSGTVDVHIRRLRKKVEQNPDQPKHILTVRGVGYKFSEE